MDGSEEEGELCIVEALQYGSSLSGDRFNGRWYLIKPPIDQEEV
jgi:hypothetical protein